MCDNSIAREGVAMRRFSGMGLCLLLVSAAAFADAPTRLVNGSFEDEPDGVAWRLPRCWSIVSGVGRNGSKAVVWDNEDPDLYVYPSQSLVVHPGSRFRFQGWVKVERGEFARLRPGIDIDWSDADGKWMGDGRASMVVDNDPNAQGWKRLEGRFTFPKGAVTARFLFYIPKGMTGRVLFDDMELVQIEEEPLVYFQCSAYRNSFVAEDGEIRFAAMLSLNTERNRLEDYSCEVRYENANGVETILPVSDFDEERAMSAISAGDFALGRQDVMFRLRLKDKVIAERPCTVVRSVERVRRRISIDRDRRVLIGGRRFFPLGMYTDRNMTTEDFRLWAQAPLNFTTMYGGTDRDTLDRFAKTGTYVCADVRSLIYGYNHSAVCRFKNFDMSRAALEKAVAELGPHPNFFGWYLADEVPMAQVPFVVNANELLQKIDPDHPTYVVSDNPRHIRDILPTFDAIGMDPYPIGGRQRDLSLASKWPRLCREAMFDFRPMWQVPQMFNWAWYRKPYVKDYKWTASLPTRREVANMTWQAIAAGANGICGYSFGSMRRNGKAAEQKKFWEDLCWVFREVKSMESVLLSDDIPFPAESVPDALVVRAFRLKGVEYLLIVNRTHKNQTAALELPEGIYSACAAVCGEGVYLDGRHLQIIFDGLGYAFLKLTR